MADFKIHKISTTIAASNTTRTLTESTDYTLDAGTTSTRAFARVTAYGRAGLDQDAASLGPDHWGVWITYATDITASLQLNRDDSTEGAIDVEVEIWECLNTSGGNEFLVLGTPTIAMTNGNATGSSATLTTPTADGNVVCFLTGVGSASTNQGALHDSLVTGVWNGATDQIDATRNATDNTATSSWAAVEFTGANWTIQKDSFTTGTSGSDASGDTITAVGAVAEAFLEVQHRGNSTGIDDIGIEVWLSSTTVISYHLESGATTGGTVVWHVIENSGLNVQTVTGTRSAAGGATFTATSPSDFTAVADLDQSSLGSITARTTATGTVSQRANMSAKLSAVGTVSMATVDDNAATTYRVQIVEWPAAAASNFVYVPYAIRY